MENKLKKMNKLTLIESYNGTGLIDENNNPINPSDLNLSENIIKNIQEWIGWYGDTYFDRDDFDIVSFNNRGIEIVKKIKIELAESYKVFYRYQEVLLNDGKAILEDKDILDLFTNSINEVSQKDEAVNIPEIENLKDKLTQLNFVEQFNNLPTLYEIGQFSLKDFSNVSDEFFEWYDDYSENIFEFFLSEPDYHIPSVDKISNRIEKKYLYATDEYDSHEDFIIDNLHYFDMEIKIALNNFNEAWEVYSTYYGDSFNSINLFFNAFYKYHIFEAEELGKILNIIHNNPHKLLSNKAKLLKAEEIAKAAHKNQPYGDNTDEDDYFIWHLDNVRNHAKSIAEKHDINPTKAQIVALLHDILEDTDYPPEEIDKIFGSNILNSIRLLTFKKNIYPINQNLFNDRKDYFAAISEDPIAKVVKAADRFVNIYQLNDLSDKNQKDNLFLKYLNDFQYFQEFNIYPKIIENAFLFLLNNH